MNSKLSWRAAVILLLAAASATAQGVWDKKEWKKWSPDECKKILEDSPWAHRWAQSDPQLAFGRGRGASPANAGAMTTNDVTLGDDDKLGIWYIVQLRTALPIREAHVRQQQIQAKYDSLDEKGRANIDQQADKILSQNLADFVIVRIYYGSNVPLYDRDLVTFWQGAYSSGIVPENAYLITTSGKRITPLKMLSPRTDTHEFELVFPRIVDGEPIVSGNSGMLSVEFYSPTIQTVTRARVLIDFKLDKMQYHGAVAY
jgi:hypothetical protein